MEIRSLDISTAVGSTPRRESPVELLALAFLLTVVVMFVRVPDRIAHPQLWAEDAAVFYIEAEVEGWSSLALPYAGYLHAYPRLVAFAGTMVPIRSVPALYVLGALATTCLAVMLALWATGTDDRGRLTALLLAGAIVTAPFAHEVWLVLTNTQWHLAAVLVLILGVRRPHSVSGRAALLALLIVASLTGPFSLILLPCAALRSLWMRDRWSLTLLLVMSASAGLTAFTMLAFPRDGAPAAITMIAEALVNRPLLSVAGAVSGSVLLLGLAVGHARRDLLLTMTSLAGLLIVMAVAAGAPAEVVVDFPRGGGDMPFSRG